MVANKFLLLMWKSYRLRRYHWIATLIEFSLPILFAFLMLRYLGSEKKYRKNDPIVGKEFPSEELIQMAQKTKTLYYAPSNDFTDQLMNNVKNSLTLGNEILVKKGNAEELDAALQTTSLSNSIGVFFRDLHDSSIVPNTLSYELRDKNSWGTALLYKSVKGSSITTLYEDEYTTNIFVGLQLSINEEFIRLKTGSTSLPQNKFIVQPFPYPSYKSNQQDTQPVFPQEVILLAVGLVVVLIVMALSVILINDVIEEKESGVKEMMKIAGVNEWLIWISWYFYAFAVSSVSLTVVAIMLKYPFHGEESENLYFVTFPVLWMILLMYCLANISYCFVFCAIFQRAAVASSVFMISFAAIIFGTLYLQKWNLIYVPMISCFFPIGAFIQAFSKIRYFEMLGIEFNWESLSLSESDKYDVSLSFILIMFVVDAIAYFLLTIYITAINPGKFGIAKSPLFIFKFLEKSPKTGTTSPDNLSPSPSINSKFFEPPPPHLEITIRMKGLFKYYGSVHAVNGVDLNIYKGEITTLLGHNGAGKTTTLSIITGLTAPSAGSVNYRGKDIFGDMETYRKNMGLCPQEDRLMSFLSVTDHLWFFGKLKGLSSAVIDHQTDKYLHIMELEGKKSSRVKELSGGMKRKLCLAISFLGKPDVLILDEPTSGIDVQSRRKIWDLLLEMRKNRSIILTTHYMEEADALGDRIAVMDQGVVVCHGTPIFLKKAYGTGYELTITKTKEANTGLITQTIQSVVPSITMEYDTKNHAVYKLPLTVTQKFPTLFKNLEANQSRLKILTIGVSYTSMEHVFLRVGGVPVYDSNKFLKEENSDSEQVSEDHKRIENKLILLIQQIIAILKKKFLYTKRNLFGLFIRIILPTIILLFVLRGTSKILDFAFDIQPSLDLSLKTYPGSRALIVQNKASSNNFYDVYSQYVNEQGAEVMDIGNPNIVKGLLESGEKNIIMYNKNFLTAVELNQTTTKVLYNAVGMFHGLPVAITTYSNALLRSIAKDNSLEIETFNNPVSQSQYSQNCASTNRQQKNSMSVIWVFVLGFYTVDIMFYFTKFINMERINGFKHIQMMSNVSPFVYWSSTLIFDWMFFLLLVALRVILFKLFDDDFYFLEFTKSFEVLVLLIILFGVSGLLFIYVISFLSSSQEGSYAAFFIINFITFMLVFVFMGYDTSYYTESGRAYIESSTTTLLIFYCGKYIILFVPLFNFSSIIMKFMIMWSTNTACDQCPPSAKDSCEATIKKSEYLVYPSSENAYGLLTGFQFLIIDAILYAILLALINMGYIEYLLNILTNTIFGTESVSQFESDGDVHKEFDNIEKLKKKSKIDEVPLLVDGLRKNYLTWFRPFTAVSNVSFIVSHGECFGLLGVNGAGKSTTFKMLTAEVLPTKGDAAIESTKLSTNKSQYLSKAGYCAQTNSFIEELTGREMLTFIASLRGVVRNDVEVVVDKWISILGLTQYQNRNCGSYSGGNKRKLCTAMSLIGNPKVVFLDEPTSGVDPVSKRKLYDVMGESRQSGQAVILTSHSMEECENLCDRLTILTAGVMRCIGSPQHLKKLYAQGFAVLMKLNVELNFEDILIDNLKHAMTDTFTPQHCTLKDEHKGLLYYQLTDTSLPWSVLFQRMEDIKHHHHDIVEDYVLTDTTLEEVFISFAEPNKDEEP